MADYVTPAPPLGEPFGAVQERAATFLAELAAASIDGAVPSLVFSHGGTIRALVRFFYLEVPLRNACKLQIDYASITTLEYQHSR